jgi:hypothetical protein
MAHRILERPEDVDTFTALLGSLKLPVTVEWVQGRDRSSQQNRLQWLWAGEAADQRGDVTQDEVQREWKLRYGVPILREDSADFRATYDKLIKPLTYPEKLEAMRFIDVSSIMKVRQMVKYLDTIQRECLENGIRLTDPDPGLADYQKRYRTNEAKAA